MNRIRVYPSGRHRNRDRFRHILPEEFLHVRTKRKDMLGLSEYATVKPPPGPHTDGIGTAQSPALDDVRVDVVDPYHVAAAQELLLKVSEQREKWRLRHDEEQRPAAHAEREARGFPEVMQPRGHAPAKRPALIQRAPSGTQADPPERNQCPKTGSKPGREPQPPCTPL